jgi:hypothetical protein
MRVNIDRGLVARPLELPSLQPARLRLATRELAYVRWPIHIHTYDPQAGIQTADRVTHSPYTLAIPKHDPEISANEGIRGDPLVRPGDDDAKQSGRWGVSVSRLADMIHTEFMRQPIQIGSTLKFRVEDFGAS